jgi:hypothetical protein
VSAAPGRTIGGVSVPADGLRASDADRDRVAIELRDHAAAGRLSPDEFDQRLEVALSARTNADLAAVLDDLPPATVPAVRSPERELARRRLAHRAGGAAILLVACVAIWVANGAHGQFWPIWVIVAGALGLGREAWRTLGPGADLTDEQLGERNRRRRRG